MEKGIFLHPSIIFADHTGVRCRPLSEIHFSVRPKDHLIVVMIAPTWQPTQDILFFTVRFYNCDGSSMGNINIPLIAVNSRQGRVKTFRNHDKAIRCMLQNLTVTIGDPGICEKHISFVREHQIDGRR